MTCRRKSSYSLSWGAYDHIRPIWVLQSGQRVGVITKIRYGDVRKQIENSISPVVIDVDPNISKNRVRHSFAIGRECVDFIKSMMKDRERWGEPIDDESILFRSLGVGKRWIEGQHKGVVLSILSTSTITGRAFTVPSAMAKSAILAMTRSLAVE